jgi:HAD superfamily hydrolase (TIGR01509 family)
MIKAIVFDMDGLMVDSEPLSRQAWDEVLRPFGHKLTDEVQSQIIGRRADVSSQVILEAFALPLAADELRARKAAVNDQLRAQGVPVMPGLMALHAEIARRAIPWAIATSSPRHHAEMTLAQLELAAACRAIAAGNEVSHGKPAPDIYLLAAARLGIEPQFCLALEDSAPGCRAALAAGMRAVAVPNGDTKTADFSFAPYVFNSLHDVLANLDELLKIGS